MAARTAQDIIWQNLEALMTYHWKKKNITKLAATAGVGNGTIQRMEKRESSTQIGSVAKVAAVFDLQPWQLLLPNLDPSNPPVILIDESEKALYKKFSEIANQVIELQRGNN